MTTRKISLFLITALLIAVSATVTRAQSSEGGVDAERQAAQPVSQGVTNISVTAQSPSVLATDLKFPLRIGLTAGGKLLVAEAGNGPNTGRISLLDRCGNRLTLLDGLPSGFGPPANEPTGPNSVALLGRSLFVLIGEGDSLRNGPVGGTRIPNPSPSSPLFSSVLAVEFSTDVDGSAGGFPFPVGRAEVRLVNPATGGFAPFITGLTMAIDVLPVKTRTGGDQFYVLEHSLTPLAQPPGPGRLTRFDPPAGPPVLIAGNLAGPAGMARDPKTGDIFVTEVFTGRVIQVLGAEFDVCLQDDRSGATLRFNSATGDYFFASCSAGFTLAGRGRVGREGCEVRLSDARVSATLDRCLIAPHNRGRARIRRTPLGPVFLINDSDTTNNTCTDR